MFSRVLLLPFYVLVGRAVTAFLSISFKFAAGDQYHDYLENGMNLRLHRCHQAKAREAFDSFRRRVVRFGSGGNRFPTFSWVINANETSGEAKALGIHEMNTCDRRSL